MASVYDDIRAALEVKLSNVSGIPDIAYENVKYDPVAGSSYVVPRFVPVSRRPAVRGPNPQLRYDGVFRVFCHTPENTGPALADDLANSVMDAFEATTDISFTNASAETVFVTIDYAERNNGIVDKAWYYVVVDIGWYCYA